MSQDVISYAFVFRQATSHCYSSLAFFIYGWLLGLESEIQHIWMQPQKRVFRWLYIYFRYVSLLIQAIHPGVMEYFAGGHGSPSSCLAWNIYVSFLGQVHVTAVEVLLAVRVYALFNRSRRIAFLVGFHILLEVISSVVNAVYTIRATEYHGYCIFYKPSHQLLYYSIIILSTQITLMGLTLSKTILTRRSGWGRTPIVSLLLRDGSAVLFVISALCLLTIGFCRLNGERATVIFFWSVSILSSCGCWLLMNTQQLVAHGRSRRVCSASIRTSVLSTIIEIE
ncbi:uncharacterized protein BJ212DRAFT_1354314 [Suillus subaureus]|uniref:DUF6533 domain-containing protein n=1 Tax=Suillus subaureus TaxID=48587 RepID=A0A9P7JDJ9_9AGAM|nr:uncharacterized protein BJ212DRAFT_1354314 [Suillus subaureus]KAG1816342.1 hypothetical protein BJ212DRAFT_1354314 [Suillus subaureus]